MTRAIGLTGGIGSGKSTAAGFLAGRGATVIDADEISRELTAAGGAALPALREAFGVGLVPPGGALDRAAMRARASPAPAAGAGRAPTLPPLTRAPPARGRPGAAGPYAVLVVPLFFESGSWAGRVERVVVVDLDPALQVSRTVARSRLAAAEVRAIMATQWPRWRRLQAADEVLWNGGGPDELEAQCERLHARLAGTGGA